MWLKNIFCDRFKFFEEQKTDSLKFSTIDHSIAAIEFLYLQNVFLLELKLPSVGCFLKKNQWLERESPQGVLSTQNPKLK